MAPKKNNLSILAKVLFVALIFLAGSGVGLLFSHKIKSNKQTTEVKKDIYLAFLDEVYTKIKENYWEKIGDETLTNLFVLVLIIFNYLGLFLKNPIDIVSKFQGGIIFLGSIFMFYLVSNQKLTKRKSKFSSV